MKIDTMDAEESTISPVILGLVDYSDEEGRIHEETPDNALTDPANSSIAMNETIVQPSDNSVDSSETTSISLPTPISSPMPSTTTPPQRDQQVCQVCESHPSKYRCPGCSRQTCSLPCVNKHKELYSCDGKRDRTAFVSASEFTENHLMSDYCLLEELYRATDNFTRDNSRLHSSQPLLTSQSPITNNNNRKRFQQNRSNLPRLSPKMLNFQKQCRFRNIRWKCMPVGMRRRNLNQSSFQQRSRMLNWSCEVILENGRGDRSVFIQHRIREDMTMGQILEGLFGVNKAGTGLRRHQVTQELGMPLLESGQWKMFLRKEECRANEQEYLECPLDKSLFHAVVGKLVVEFPSFLVITETDLEERKLSGDVKGKWLQWEEHQVPTTFVPGKRKERTDGNKEEKEVVEEEVEEVEGEEAEEEVEENVEQDTESIHEEMEEPEELEEEVEGAEEDLIEDFEDLEQVLKSVISEK